MTKKEKRLLELLSEIVDTYYLRQDVVYNQVGIGNMQYSGRVSKSQEQFILQAVELLKREKMLKNVDDFKRAPKAVKKINREVSVKKKKCKVMKGSNSMAKLINRKKEFIGKFDVEYPQRDTLTRKELVKMSERNAGMKWPSFLTGDKKYRLERGVFNMKLFKEDVENAGK